MSTDGGRTVRRDRFVLRFVGRFVFAYTGSKEAPSAVRVVAVDMAFNQDLAIPAHRLFLVAPRRQVQVLGTRLPDLTLFGLTRRPDAKAQLVAWDLGGYDVTAGTVSSER